MISLTQAQKYINKALSIAKENDQNIAVAIVDEHGELIIYDKWMKQHLMLAYLNQPAELRWRKRQNIHILNRFK